MKNKIYIALLALVLGFYFVNSKSQAAPSPATWEYKLVDSPSEKKCNELGAEGWELVTITTKGGSSSMSMTSPLYAFKRAK